MILGLSEHYFRFREAFAEAVDADAYGIEDLDEKMAAGTGILWCSDNAAIIAEVRHYPRGMAIHGVIAAGELAEIVEQLIPAAEEWGRRAGCKFAEIESRGGWQRALKGSGYDVHQVTVRKVL